MPEPKNKENQDKARKTRSFGSFALILFVLAAIFLLWGGHRFQPRVELTQDLYEWYLYGGDVKSQSILGTNVVEGTLDDGRLFSVRFADVGQRESLYRELKAVQNIRPIDPPQLQRALEGGWYQPILARHLTAYGETVEELTPAKAAEPRPGEAAVQKQVNRQHPQTDRLLLQATARPVSAWRAEHTEDPPFHLPQASGTVWLEVRDVDDFAALTSSLRARSVPVETLAFDISRTTGTKAEESSSILTQALFMWGPLILVFVIILFFMRQMRNQGGAGGVMNFGRSRAQLYSKENHVNVTFDDVAGADEAKEEVKEIVEFLKNPGRFTRLGGRIPRGVLLVGSPGCGKTLLAKAIAGEAEVPFFSISGSDFVEMFVGVGASRVRDLFKQARENSPCIIFLDEIDAVGRRRGSGMGGGHDEREQTLNAILVEMDGFGTDEGIIVIAATNRPDVLDPALLRPGRFDREVTIDLPDLAGREQILKVHLKKVKVGTDVDVVQLARGTPGYSGADLAAIINEAAIMAALQRRDEISMEHLDEAREKVMFGRQKRSREMEEADRKITAYHEAGHAVVGAMIPEVDPPSKVTIVPRGRALGLTTFLPEKEQYHMQRRRLVGQLAVGFGGRIAEAQFCGDISAGASGDIKQNTELARRMVTELGMSDKIGPVNFAERQGSEFLGTELMSAKWHSEETAREIDQEIQRILREAYERAEAILSQNRQAVENLTAALLRYETITGEEVKELLAGASLDALRPGSPPPAPRAPGSRAETGKNAPKTAPGGELPGTPGLSPA
ncbi:MAG: ATP-dependent zinc metalloprotease FtsH [Planctomycetes bacterium]|nr:ATP-dependent zinc metalloprotease FtsH [Planctomycetota bacterium]